MALTLRSLSLTFRDLQTGSLVGSLRTIKQRSVGQCLCRTIFRRMSMVADNTDDKNEEFTHFGYSKVKENEKAEKVYKVFEGVAEKYDVMNDLMSGGVHRLWKNYFVSHMKPRKESTLLDVAGGTGDIAFRYIDAIAKANSRDGPFVPSPSSVVVCDINREMLRVGKRRAELKKLDEVPVTCICLQGSYYSGPDARRRVGHQYVKIKAITEEDIRLTGPDLVAAIGN